MESKQNRLLVIDKDETKRDALSQNLKGLGYAVTLAGDARQALKMLGLDNSAATAEAREFDLVLLGPGCPEVDGCEILKQLKADSKLGELPVIVTSTSDDVERILKYVELGAEDYLIEPFNPLLLKTRIGAWLEKKQLRDQTHEYAKLLKLEHDLQIGRQIQNDFLPDKDDLPQPEGWEIAARFKPARAVAGDFFDAFPITGGKVGLVIADVTDKGVGAALFMSLSRSLIRAFAEQHRPLGWMDSLTTDITDKSVEEKSKRKDKRRVLLSAGTSALLAVELTNSYIAKYHSSMNMFVTLFFGVLDPATGMLTYINGGHNPPVVIGADGAVKARLTPTGPAVGMLPDMDFGIDQIKLGPGDLLMTFTDGVPEARAPDREFFSEERLLALLQQPAPSVVVLLDRIENSLQDFIAEADQFDDITMLAVRRAPKA